MLELSVCAVGGWCFGQLAQAAAAGQQQHADQSVAPIRTATLCGAQTTRTTHDTRTVGQQSGWECIILQKSVVCWFIARKLREIRDFKKSIFENLQRGVAWARKQNGLIQSEP